jgi:hypothetical protein
LTRLFLLAVVLLPATAFAQTSPSAPAAPAKVSPNGALASGTAVAWPAVPGAAGYRIRWRSHEVQGWTDSRDLPATATETVLKNVIIDDTFIGVSALSADGSESMVTFGERPVVGLR